MRWMTLAFLLFYTVALGTSFAFGAYAKNMLALRAAKGVSMTDALLVMEGQMRAFRKYIAAGTDTAGFLESSP